MKILYDNEIFNATISASTEDPDYDFDTALNDTRLSRYGRTILDSSQWLKFSFSAAIDVDFVYISDFNFTGSATVHIQANATDSWGSPSIDQAITVSSDGNYYLYEFSSTESYQYWRITIDDGSNPDTYLQIGYVFLGTEITLPAINPDASLPYTSNATVTKSPSGHLFGDRRVRLKEAKVVFPTITETERQAMLAFFNYVDITIPFLLLIWEDDLDVEPPLYCNMTKSIEPTKLVSGGNLWTAGFEFEECR